MSDLTGAGIEPHTAHTGSNIVTTTPTGHCFQIPTNILIGSNLVEPYHRRTQGRLRCHAPPPPPLPSNKVLKPKFQVIISQINNGYSLLSLILAKLLLLDISCKNIFALFIMTALTRLQAFFDKKNECFFM